MAQKTALQDLIAYLVYFKNKYPLVDQATIDAAIKFSELRLEMEKDQIKKAWNDHKNNKWGFKYTIVNGEDYYKKTYEQHE